MDMQVIIMLFLNSVISIIYTVCPGRTAVYPVFMQMLIRQDECLEFDPALFIGVVEKVVVSGTKKNVQLRFVLGDGEEHMICGGC